MACDGHLCSGRPAQPTQPEWLQALAKPSVNLDAQEHWLKCNPTGLSAELQRLGENRAWNEQARFLNTPSFTSAKVSFAMVLHCISILHPVVLRVHTDYRLDHIVRCNYHADGGPGATFEVLSQRLMVDTLGRRRRTHVDGGITCSLVDRGQGGPLNRVCAIATTGTPSHCWAENAAQP